MGKKTQDTIRNIHTTQRKQGSLNRALWDTTNRREVSDMQLLIEQIKHLSEIYIFLMDDSNYPMHATNG